MRKLSREQHKDLITACNLLCEYVGEALPREWQITLEMRRGESSISLIDPTGQELDMDGADTGISTVADLCETAERIMNEIENPRRRRRRPIVYPEPRNK